MKPPNAQYLAARRGVFARGITRNFASDAAPLFRAVEHARKEIQAAGALDDIPPFTDIAVKYGALLTRSLLLSFVKGSDNARKRKYRKNSLSLDDILDFSWDLPNTAAVAAFYREAFEMAAVHTQDLRDALFADAKEVFAQAAPIGIGRTTSACTASNRPTPTTSAPITIPPPTPPIQPVTGNRS